MLPCIRVCDLCAPVRVTSVGAVTLSSVKISEFAEQHPLEHRQSGASEFVVQLDARFDPSHLGDLIGGPSTLLHRVVPGSADAAVDVNCEPT